MCSLQFFLCCLFMSLSSACPTGWYQSLTEVNKCFFVSTELMTWTDADQFCRNFGGTNSHLTSVLSAFEANDISAVAANNPSISPLDQVWIGAKGIEEDTRFVWADGSPMIYTNWLAGQPSLLYSCVSSLAKSSGKWRTEPCETTKNFFVCKYLMQPTATPSDCFDLYFNNGNMTSGIYQISPPGVAPFQVLCDMETDGGGWTVIQRRQDQQVEFWNRVWQAYKAGFDNGLQNNSWLGLDRIHALTTKDGTNVTLRIDVFHNRCPKELCGYGYDPNGYWYSEWDFYVESEVSNYTMHASIAKFGNLTSQDDQDLLHYFNDNRPFTTQDRDNDSWPDGNCAVHNSLGGWWHSWCTSFALNGKYEQTPNDWGGFGYSCQHYYFWLDNYMINPARSEMKIRRNNF